MPPELRRPVSPPPFASFLIELCAWLVALAGVLVTIGWAVGSEGLQTFGPGPTSMTLNTALAMVTCAIALILLVEAPVRGRRVARGLGAAAATLGLLTLAEYTLGLDLGIDELIVDDPGTASAHPGRMAPNTALAIFALGTALWLQRGAGQPRRWTAWIGGVGGGIGYVALVGQAAGLPSFYAAGEVAGMAVSTAACIGLIGLGVVLLDESRASGLLVATTRGGHLMRRLLPAALILPVVIGLLRVQGEAIGLFDRESGVFLFALTDVLALAVLIFVFARSLDRSDRQREAAEEQVRLSLETAHQAFISIDSRGRIVEWNPAAESTFGWRRKEVLGEVLSETIIPPAMRKAHERGLKHFLETGEGPVLGKRIEVRAIHRSGRELPVEITISPLETADGWRFNAFIQDISEREAATEALGQSEERFRALVTQAPAGIYETSVEGSCLFASERWCALAGLTQEEALGTGWSEAIHPDDKAGVLAAWEESVEAETDFERDYRFLRPNGTVVWVSGRATGVRNSNGEIAGYVGTCLDITAAREADASVRAAEERFRSTFEDAPIGMAVTDLEGRFQEVNASLLAITGYSQEELVGSSSRMITHPDDLEADLEATRSMLAGGVSAHSVEKRFMHAGGKPVWVSAHVTLVRDDEGEPAYFLSQVQDVTERRRYEQRLEHMADHDPLTGLLNRRSFERELERHVASVGRYGAQGAALVLDLDHFKYYNDTLGHNAGDELIVRVAEALRERLRETDVLARLGGDEFAVILPREDAEGAQRVARDILVRIRRETARAAPGNRRGITASIGVAMFTDEEGTGGEDVLVNADLAMYDAKESGRDQIGFFSSPEPNQARMKGRVRWADEIQNALDRDGFALMAQPIMDLASSEVVRHELLLRMRTEQGDLVPPGSFLYIAERLGLVNEIDRWVVSRAIDVLAEEREAGRKREFEVNLSGHSIGDEPLLELIENRLEATGIPPDSLTFEITETAAVANIAKARTFAERLSDLGCSFALDDFGAGFGSFYYLKHLPFDLLKIDGEFVRNCASNSTDGLLIEAVVTIAQGLGKRTVAEFVGDDRTIEVLRELGVDMGQGFHLGRPVPLDEMLHATADVA